MTGAERHRRQPAPARAERLNTGIETAPDSLHCFESPAVAAYGSLLAWLECGVRRASKSLTYKVFLECGVRRASKSLSKIYTRAVTIFSPYFLVLLHYSAGSGVVWYKKYRTHQHRVVLVLPGAGRIDCSLRTLGTKLREQETILPGFTQPSWTHIFETARPSFADLHEP